MCPEVPLPGLADTVRQFSVDSFSLQDEIPSICNLKQEIWSEMKKRADFYWKAVEIILRKHINYFHEGILCIK